MSDGGLRTTPGSSLLEARPEAVETLKWIKGWRDGQFTPAHTEDGWSVELHGLADSAERLARAILGATADEVLPGDPVADPPPYDGQQPEESWWDRFGYFGGPT